MFPPISTKVNEWKDIEDICGAVPQIVRGWLANDLDLKRILAGDFTNSGPFLEKVREMVFAVGETNQKGEVRQSTKRPADEPIGKKKKAALPKNEGGHSFDGRMGADLEPSGYLSVIVRRHAEVKYARLIELLRKPFNLPIREKDQNGIWAETGDYYPDAFPLQVSKLKDKLNLFLQHGDTPRAQEAATEIFAEMVPDWIANASASPDGGRALGEWANKYLTPNTLWSINQRLGVQTDFWGRDIEYIPLRSDTNKSFYLSMLKLSVGIVGVDMLWPEEHALLFLLCGATPPPGTLKAKYIVRHDLPCLSRITLTVMPTMPEAEILELYAELKRKLLAGKQPQKVTNQKMAVASFVYGWKGSYEEIESRTQADKKEWRRLMDEWNSDSCPLEEWEYDHPSRFERDARTGYRYLATPSLTAPRSYIHAPRGQTDEDYEAYTKAQLERERHYWEAKHEESEERVARVKARGKNAQMNSKKEQS